MFKFFREYLGEFLKRFIDIERKDVILTDYKDLCFDMRSRLKDGSVNIIVLQSGDCLYMCIYSWV